MLEMNGVSVFVSSLLCTSQSTVVFIIVRPSTFFSPLLYTYWALAVMQVVDNNIRVV